MIARLLNPQSVFATRTRTDLVTGQQTTERPIFKDIEGYGVENTYGRILPKADAISQAQWEQGTRNALPMLYLSEALGYKQPTEAIASINKGIYGWARDNPTDVLSTYVEGAAVGAEFGALNKLGKYGEAIALADDTYKYLPQIKKIAKASEFINTEVIPKAFIAQTGVGELSNAISNSAGKTWQQAIETAAPGFARTAITMQGMSKGGRIGESAIESIPKTLANVKYGIGEFILNRGRTIRIPTEPKSSGMTPDVGSGLFNTKIVLPQREGVGTTSDKLIPLLKEYKSVNFDIRERIPEPIKSETPYQPATKTLFDTIISKAKDPSTLATAVLSVGTLALGNSVVSAQSDNEDNLPLHVGLAAFGTGIGAVPMGGHGTERLVERKQTFKIEPDIPVTRGTNAQLKTADFGGGSSRVIGADVVDIRSQKQIFRDAKELLSNNIQDKIITVRPRTVSASVSERKTTATEPKTHLGKTEYAMETTPIYGKDNPLPENIRKNMEGLEAIYTHAKKYTNKPEQYFKDEYQQLLKAGNEPTLITVGGETFSIVPMGEGSYSIYSDKTKLPLGHNRDSLASAISELHDPIKNKYLMNEAKKLTAKQALSELLDIKSEIDSTKLYGARAPRGNPVINERVVELGGGNNIDTRIKAGDAVFDLSTKLYNKQKGVNYIEGFDATTQKIPYADSSVDKLLSSGGAWWTFIPKTSEMSRILKPETGRIEINLPHAAARDNPEIVRRAKTDLNQAGLQIISEKRVKYPDGSVRWQIIAKKPMTPQQVANEAIPPARKSVDVPTAFRETLGGSLQKQGMIRGSISKKLREDMSLRTVRKGLTQSEIGIKDIVTSEPTTENSLIEYANKKLSNINRGDGESVSMSGGEALKADIYGTHLGGSSTHNHLTLQSASEKDVTSQIRRFVKMETIVSPDGKLFRMILPDQIIKSKNFTNANREYIENLLHDYDINNSMKYDEKQYLSVKKGINNLKRQYPEYADIFTEILTNNLNGQVEYSMTRTNMIGDGMSNSFFRSAPSTPSIDSIAPLSKILEQKGVSKNVVQKARDIEFSALDQARAQKIADMLGLIGGKVEYTKRNIDGSHSQRFTTIRPKTKEIDGIHEILKKQSTIIPLPISGTMELSKKIYHATKDMISETQTAYKINRGIAEIKDLAKKVDPTPQKKQSAVEIANNAITNQNQFKQRGLTNGAWSIGSGVLLEVLGKIIKPKSATTDVTTTKPKVERYTPDRYTRTFIEGATGYVTTESGALIPKRKGRIATLRQPRYKNKLLVEHGNRDFTIIPITSYKPRRGVQNPELIKRYNEAYGYQTSPLGEVGRRMQTGSDIHLHPAEIEGILPYIKSQPGISSRVYTKIKHDMNADTFKLSNYHKNVQNAIKDALDKHFKENPETIHQAYPSSGDLISSIMGIPRIKSTIVYRTGNQVVGTTYKVIPDVAWKGTKPNANVDPGYLKSKLNKVTTKILNTTIGRIVEGKLLDASESIKTFNKVNQFEALREAVSRDVEKYYETNVYPVIEKEISTAWDIKNKQRISQSTTRKELTALRNEKDAYMGREFDKKFREILLHKEERLNDEFYARIGKLWGLDFYKLRDISSRKGTQTKLTTSPEFPVGTVNNLKSYIHAVERLVTDPLYLDYALKVSGIREYPDVGSKDQYIKPQSPSQLHTKGGAYPKAAAPDKSNELYPFTISTTPTTRKTASHMLPIADHLKPISMAGRELRSIVNLAKKGGLPSQARADRINRMLYNDQIKLWGKEPAEKWAPTTGVKEDKRPLDIMKGYTADYGYDLNGNKLSSPDEPVVFRDRTTYKDSDVGSAFGDNISFGDLALKAKNAAINTVARSKYVIASGILGATKAPGYEGDIAWHESHGTIGAKILGTTETPLGDFQYTTRATPERLLDSTLRKKPGIFYHGSSERFGREIQSSGKSGVKVKSQVSVASGSGSESYEAGLFFGSNKQINEQFLDRTEPAATRIVKKVEPSSISFTRMAKAQPAIGHNDRVMAILNKDPAYNQISKSKEFMEDNKNTNFNDPESSFIYRENGVPIKRSIKELHFRTAIEGRNLHDVKTLLIELTKAQEDLKKYGGYDNYMKNSPTAIALKKEDYLMKRASRTAALQNNKQLLQKSKINPGIKPAYGETYVGIPELEFVVSPQTTLYPVSTPRTRYYAGLGDIRGSAFTVSPHGKHVEIHDVATVPGIVKGEGEVYKPSLVEKLLVRNAKADKLKSLEYIDERGNYIPPFNVKGEFGSKRKSKQTVREFPKYPTYSYSGFGLSEIRAQKPKTTKKHIVTISNGFMSAYEQAKPTKKQTDKKAYGFDGVYAGIKKDIEKKTDTKSVTGYAYTDIYSGTVIGKRKKRAVKPKVKAPLSEKSWLEVAFKKE